MCVAMIRVRLIEARQIAVSGVFRCVRQHFRIRNTCQFMSMMPRMLIVVGSLSVFGTPLKGIAHAMNRRICGVQRENKRE